MKKTFNILLMGLVLFTVSSCKKYLDVNENPNSPTASTPDLVLPQALVTTANTNLTFNNYGAWVAGYQANASGYGAYGGGVLTYQYTTTDNNGLFTGPYSNIKDYNYVLTNTTPTGDQKYFNAAARTMIAYQFQKMVDQFGDIPYFDSFKGAANLTPKYDKGEDIYKDLVAQLNTAIASFSSAATGTTQGLGRTSTGVVDPMFGGDISRWIQFANTLKLRMLVRIAKVSSLTSFVAAQKASLPTSNAGYITDDVLVNPEYTNVAGKVNPMFASYAWTTTSGSADLTRIPTRFAVAFYDGGKLTDRHRGAAIYRGFYPDSTAFKADPTKPIVAISNKKNQLGIITGTYDAGIAGSPWFSQEGVATPKADNTGANATSIGIIKGATAGQVLMLAAESYFLQAEAGLPDLNIVTTAVPDSNFVRGIRASYRYLYKTPANVVSTLRNNVAGAPYSADKSEKYYHAANPATLPAGGANPYAFLVNFELATSTELKREAIVTQKYIAMNLITSDEAWNEYRRTGYPRSTGTSAITSFASTQSTITSTPDRLPRRVLYPDEEFKLNPTNVPKNATAITPLFWQKENLGLN